MRVAILAALALLLASLVMLPAAKKPPPDVLMLVVDTLRADRLAHYGNRTDLTPFLNELAKRSNVVTRTYAQAPWTNPSVASLFTSRFPSQHGITTYNSVLAADEETLAESLKAAGYATAAFSANGLISKFFRFDQGFDVYKAELKLGGTDEPLLRPTKRASELFDQAFEWLDSVPRHGTQRRPVFLYLQFMETHTPYAPSREMLDRVRASKPPLDLKSINRAAVTAKLYPPNAQLLEDIRDAYDASVMEIDAALREYFAALESRGMLDQALVIVTADHGDEFMEHGAFSHGDTLYDEALRVPLLVRTPGQADGHVIDRLVSLVDVAPTVLELAGVARPARFEGASFALDLEPDGIFESLRRAVARLMDERPEPVAFSERRMDAAKEPPTAHVRSLVAESAKLIESADSSRVFYDLASDPREQSPNELGDAGRSMLTSRLGAMQSRIRKSAANAEERELDQQSREALRALGYAQ